MSQGPVPGKQTQGACNRIRGTWSQADTPLVPSPRGVSTCIMSNTKNRPGTIIRLAEPTLITYNPSTGTILLLSLSANHGAIPSKPMKLCGIPLIVTASLRELSLRSNAIVTQIGIVTFMDFYLAIPGKLSRVCYFHGKSGKRFTITMVERLFHRLGVPKMCQPIVQSM